MIEENNEPPIQPSMPSRREAEEAIHSTIDHLIVEGVALNTDDAEMMIRSGLVDPHIGN